MKARLPCALALVAALAGGLWAQTSPAPSPTPAPAAASAADPFAGRPPEPYGADEFPEWVEDLHRFETVAVGSFPFAFFFAGFAFDAVRFATHSFDMRYAPWPFKGAGSVDLDDGEKLAVVCISVGVSIVIGLIDYFIRDAERKAKAADEARRAAKDDPSLAPPGEGPPPDLVPAGAPAP